MLTEKLTLIRNYDVNTESFPLNFLNFFVVDLFLLVFLI